MIRRAARVATALALCAGIALGQPAPGLLVLVGIGLTILALVLLLQHITEADPACISYEPRRQLWVEMNHYLWVEQKLLDSLEGSVMVCMPQELIL